MTATSTATRNSTDRLAFVLPPELEATVPPESRGMTRDAVRMMVARRSDNSIAHSTFVMLPSFLDEGDLVVINTSGTIPSAIEGVGADGTPVVIHLSTHLGGDLWVVEPRRAEGSTTARWTGTPPPKQITVGADASVELVRSRAGGRLWEAQLTLPQPLLAWLAVNGRPIRYGYVKGSWPVSAYQNVFATEPGSAEMPSAGRPFTADVITRLVTKGIGVCPILLHTGVASLEANETPYPERFSVAATTARRVNETRRAGGRVIAVGTTVVRALESATRSGRVVPRSGWARVVITPERGVRVVDGLLTGWHEPVASHLMMLEAVAGRPLLETSYAAALDAGYLWHEFGDVHLILP